MRVSRRSGVLTAGMSDHRVYGLIIAAILWAGWPASDVALGQNDWQYPDPYFGAIEIEKSRSPAAERRYRADVRPPSVQQSPYPASQHAPRRQRWSQRRHRAQAPVAVGPR